MDKPIACIELGASGVKLLVGYCLNGEPYCIYRTFRKIRGAYNDGQITDPKVYSAVLSTFHEVKDEQAKVSINISDFALVLPSVGLQVYENEKTTGTTASSNEIAKLDISNVVSLVRKQNIPGNNAIVDIVPDEFILDNGERYANPPFGKKSESITIKAKIHTLPEGLLVFYKNLVQHEDFRISGESVSTYCLAEWIKTMPDLPTSYILLDMGAKTTSVSLIGNGSPYGSQSFFLGGQDLTEMIAEGLSLEEGHAEILKLRYGYDERQIAYDPPFAAFAGPEYATCQYKQKDLNNIISSYFEEFGGLAKNAINQLLSKYNGRFDTLPLVVTGGASRLFGVKTFLSSVFPRREIFFAKSKTVGCLDEGYGALLGLLVAKSQYKGTLGDNHTSMASVSRVSPKKEKTKRPSLEDDTL